jgi:glycosyltransferase involved in cell wall biosynthesis
MDFIKKIRRASVNAKRYIATTRPVLVTAYNWHRFKNSLYNSRKNRKSPRVSPQSFAAAKNVVFVHSKMHFYPPEDIPTRPNYHSGIANVARHIWKLCEGKQRFFVDIKERNLQNIPKADVVIGLMSENWRKCAAANPQALKILLLVNCHPLFRAKTLLCESKKLHKHIPYQEWIKPSLFLKLRPYTDLILLTGNAFIKQTYEDNGVTEIPVREFDIGVNTEILVPDPKKRPLNKVRFVYPASHMGIRKGFFRMLDAWKKLNELVSPDKIELIFVGGNEASFKKEFIDFLQAYPNAKNFGWASEEEQLAYFQSSHAVVAPALEEGQVSAPLEAAACGAVLIVSKECGINLAPDTGFLIKNHADTHEIAHYMKLLVDDAQLREQMSEHVATWVHSHFNWREFEERFKKLL